jgi:hypothetical protein
MPRMRRRSKPHRGYSPEDIKQLLTGVSLSRRFGVIHKRLADLAAMQAAWDQLRDSLLPAWVAQNPFSRPLVYWLFDATEPREHVIGEQKLEAIEHAIQGPRRTFRLCYFESLNDRLGVPTELGEYESESQYLRRLNLLFDSERELL